MNEREAQECLAKIKHELATSEHHFQRGQHHYTKAREAIWNLHEYQGWRALGYGSWRECVKAEFERGQSTLYKQLSAAAVERQISPDGVIGAIPERILRPLARKAFTEETRRTLWEVAKSISGAEASITSGTMEAVVEVLGEAIVTGTLQDADGEQHPLFERVRADVMARAVETRKRHQQYLQQGAGEKLCSAIEAIPSVEGANSVAFRVSGVFTPKQLETLQNAKNGVKITVWIDG